MFRKKGSEARFDWKLEVLCRGFIVVNRVRKNRTQAVIGSLSFCGWKQAGLGYCKICSPRARLDWRDWGLDGFLRVGFSRE